MSALAKAIRTLLTDPGLFRDLILRRLDEREERRNPGTPQSAAAIEYDELLALLRDRYGAGVDEALEEPALAEIERHVAERTKEKSEDGALPAFWNASDPLARVCYALVRVIRPSIVVETGVAYGRTSAYMLTAMAENGHGQLHSVDWTPTARAEIGALIPDELRGRWDLRYGPSRRLLPALVQEIGAIDMFVADAMHTYNAVLRELTTVQPGLAPSAAVLVDDIQDHGAFGDWAARLSPGLAEVVSAGGRNEFGAAVLGTVSERTATE
jgi:predicted O-methyltransferase YrrM